MVSDRLSVDRQHDTDCDQEQRNTQRVPPASFALASDPVKRQSPRRTQGAEAGAKHPQRSDHQNDNGGNDAGMNIHDKDYSR